MLIRKNASVFAVDAKGLLAVIPLSRVASQDRVTVPTGYRGRVIVDRPTGLRATAQREIGIRREVPVHRVTSAKEIVPQHLPTAREQGVVRELVVRVAERLTGADRPATMPIAQVAVVTVAVTERVAVVIGVAIRPTGVRAVVVKHRRRPMFGKQSSRPTPGCRAILPIGVPTVGATVGASARKIAG